MHSQREVVTLLYQRWGDEREERKGQLQRNAVVPHPWHPLTTTTVAEEKYTHTPIRLYVYTALTPVQC